MSVVGIDDIWLDDVAVPFDDCPHTVARREDSRGADLLVRVATDGLPVTTPDRSERPRASRVSGCHQPVRRRTCNHQRDKGIGRAVLERWLADGGSAWATDVTEPPLSHPGVVSRALDVTDPMSWSMIMAEVESSSGSIDTLLLCHGVSQPHVPTADLDLVDWNRVLDINLTGCFLGIQATLPAMVERGFGRVVAVASIAAKEASAGEHVYAASKAGLVALIKSVGKEVATTGVTLNSVAPGPVETPLGCVERFAEVGPTAAHSDGTPRQARRGRIDHAVAGVGGGKLHDGAGLRRQRRARHVLNLQEIAAGLGPIRRVGRGDAQLGHGAEQPEGEHAAVGRECGSRRFARGDGVRLPARIN